MPPARLTYSHPNDPLLRRAIIQSIEYATGRRKLERIYNEVRDRQLPPLEIWGAALQGLQIDLQYDANQLAKTPTQGAVVFIANHPFGVVDGLALGHLIAQTRPHFALLVNEVLCREEQLQPHLLPIDFRETKDALQTNLRTRTHAIQRLRAGEALGIFPSGGVATSPRLFATAQDLEWKRFTARMIQQTQATVVPLYFHGRNSHLFQFASQINLHLRLSFLLHEIRNKMGKTIRISIGEPIPYATLAPYKERQDLLDYLRERTFSLANESM
ncbi:MAG TPA: lysophospholipid acyltransferase family protein [Saprospiraceae bacterium]|nr:lysophospholipid acyltransferase family protein [Saprospiraceae bacterium]HMP13779.1 lysophospholipid acyltransferase family protein [Saprospiraceae bacterium]